MHPSGTCGIGGGRRRRGLGAPAPRDEAVHGAGAVPHRSRREGGPVRVRARRPAVRDREAGGPATTALSRAHQEVPIRPAGGVEASGKKKPRRREGGAKRRGRGEEVVLGRRRGGRGRTTAERGSEGGSCSTQFLDFFPSPFTFRQRDRETRKIYTLPRRISPRLRRRVRHARCRRWRVGPRARCAGACRLMGQRGQRPAGWLLPIIYICRPV